MTHICVGTPTIIGSDNGLSPERRQSIIWTSAGIVLTGPFGIHFNEILIKIHSFLFKKMYLKTSSGKLWACCLGLNILRHPCAISIISFGFLLLPWGQSRYSPRPVKCDLLNFHPDSIPFHGHKCVRWYVLKFPKLLRNPYNGHGIPSGRKYLAIINVPRHLFDRS